MRCAGGSRACSSSARRRSRRRSRARRPLLVFQDTSVLINFYRPGLFKVLGDLFERKVRWTGSVRRDQHLGEAETIAIIQKRQLHALIAIDDEEAGKWADPVPCVGTWRLIKLARRRGDASPDEASRLWQIFVDAGGHLPYKIRTLPQFQTWIDADWSGP